MIKLALIIVAAIVIVSVLFGFLSNRRKVQEVRDGALIAGGCLFRLAVYGLVLSASVFLLLKVFE